MVCTPSLASVVVGTLSTDSWVLSGLLAWWDVWRDSWRSTVFLSWMNSAISSSSEKNTDHHKIVQTPKHILDSQSDFKFMDNWNSRIGVYGAVVKTKVKVCSRSILCKDCKMWLSWSRQIGVRYGDSARALPKWCRIYSVRDREYGNRCKYRIVLVMILRKRWRVNCIGWEGKGESLKCEVLW